MMKEVRIHHTPAHVIKSLSRVQVVSLVDNLHVVDPVIWQGGHRTVGNDERWQRLNRRLPVNLRVVLMNSNDFKAKHKREWEQWVLDDSHLPPMDPTVPTHTFWKTWNNSHRFSMPLTPWILVHRWHHALYASVSSHLQATWIGNCLSLAQQESLTQAVLANVMDHNKLQGWICRRRVSDAKFTSPIGEALVSHWHAALAKGLISAGSAQGGRLNPQDTAAEFFTAHMLQPRKWQHHVDHFEHLLPKTVKLDWSEVDSHVSRMYQDHRHQTQWGNEQKAIIQAAFDEVWRGDLKIRHARAMRDHLLELNRAAYEVINSGKFEWRL